MTPLFARLGVAVIVLATLTSAGAQPGPNPGPSNPAPPSLAPSVSASPIPRSPIGPRAAAGGDDNMQQSLTLADATLEATLEVLENLTGRTILRPNQLPPATITIKITRPMPKSDVVLALETILSLNQIGVIPMGDRFLKIVALPQAKGEAPEFIEGSALDLPSSGKIATKLFQLDFLRAGEAFQNGPAGAGLASLLSQGIGGGVVVLAQANAVLVTDTVANLQRLEVLLHEIDRPKVSSFTPKFYSLRHQQATDVVTKMKALLTGPIQVQIGTATTFQPDDRTNQIVVIADEREIPFFDDLIAKLDVKSDPNTRTVVIYLKHADAKDVQTLLASVVSGQTAATQKAGNQAVRPEQVTGTASGPFGQAAGAGASMGTPGNVGGEGSVGGALAGAGAGAAGGARGGPVGASAAGSTEFTSLATILADERSNAVVVSGTVEDVALMEELVNQIDIPLTQVKIEVIIAEVTLSDTDISGLSALNLGVTTSSTGKTSVSTFAGSVAGWDVTGGTVNPFAVNAALNSTSVGSKNVVHVLSAPMIMTASNKPADFTDGEQLPIINGGTTSTATTGGVPESTFTTSYVNVAIELNVTPIIGDNGDVQLTIDQQVNDVIGNTTGTAGSQQPIIGHREAKSYVTVKDGEMIVLGGLQRTQKSSLHAKLGFLYEIPILSELLGGHTDDLERTELLFFVRPHIVPPEKGTPDTIKDINSMSNRDQIEEFLKDPSNAHENKAKNMLDRFKGD
jgi:general secretion pathway protein D